MKLYRILESILKESDEEVVEFPNDNFSVSFFPNEKKILFSPQEHSSLTKNIQEYINMINERFLVLKINNKGQGMFELEFDPREDFNAVVDFIKQEEERE